MRHNIRPIGWFMRNLPKGSPVATFWHTLGFPLLRRIGTAMDILWAGEVVVIELAFSDNAAAASSAAWGYMPVFRTTALDSLIARLRTAGLEPSDVVERDGDREATYLDPTGHPVAFRQRSPKANLPQDVEARRRAMRGEAFNPGCGKSPADIQELGWIRRRVADVPAMAAFYTDVVGYAALGTDKDRALFDLGDNVILELVSGGTAITPPTDRKGANEYIIHRVEDLAQYRPYVAAHGAKIVNESISVYWGEIAYIADPEGYLIGLECARHPGTYAPEKLALAEGIEAQRRWREYKSTRPG